MLFSKNNTLPRILELDNNPYITSCTPNKSLSFSKVGFGIPARKRPYFTMESAVTAILRDASGKMHHGILFDRRLPFVILSTTMSSVRQ